MESTDSDQVFHSYLCKTQRRRLIRADGSFAGWLIYDAEGVYTEFPVSTPTASAATPLGDTTATAANAATAPATEGSSPPR